MGHLLSKIGWVQVSSPLAGLFILLEEHYFALYFACEEEARAEVGTIPSGLKSGAFS